MAIERFKRPPCYNVHWAEIVLSLKQTNSGLITFNCKASSFTVFCKRQSNQCLDPQYYVMQGVDTDLTNLKFPHLLQSTSTYLKAPKPCNSWLEKSYWNKVEEAFCPSPSLLVLCFASELTGGFSTFSVRLYPPFAPPAVPPPPTNTSLAKCSQVVSAAWEVEVPCPLLHPCPPTSLLPPPPGKMDLTGPLSRPKTQPRTSKHPEPMLELGPLTMGPISNHYQVVDKLIFMIKNLWMNFILCRSILSTLTWE